MKTDKDLIESNNILLINQFPSPRLAEHVVFLTVILPD